MDLSAERWEGLTLAERTVLAKRLAKQLPSGFTFHTIRRFRLGESQHDVALYRKDDATFALIPSTAVSLGFDADRPWEPNPDELDSWQDTSKEFGIAKTLQEYIREGTLRVRQVEISPLLIETATRELGWESIGIDDPEVQGILREYGTERDIQINRGHAITRVFRGEQGKLIAERSVAYAYEDLTVQMAETGFRFPTSDEWEYACGGGATTLFRWGDHVPCDRYPTDVRPPDIGSDWDHHRQPNAFGLLIASNPYQYELVAQAGVTRGGDGGSNICGGAGFFMGWLTLATAYFEEHSCKHDETEPISHGYTFGRRVLELR
jgi:hypothetical protein